MDLFDRPYGLCYGNFRGSRTLPRESEIFYTLLR